MFGRWFGWRRVKDPAAEGLPPAAEVAAPASRGEDESIETYFTRLAEHYLSAADAQTWLRLLRPAAQLIPAGDGPVVARLGGLPRLPEAVEWPQWPGHGPLAFVGEIDLAALAVSGVDPGVALPVRGRLLAFYWDGSLDRGMAIVDAADPETLAGARLLQVTDAEEDCAERQAPDGVHVYVEQPLTARQILTAPDPDHPDLGAAFPEESAEFRTWLDHPVNAAAFLEAVDQANGPYPSHQIGGYASPVQGPVESEVAWRAVPDADGPVFASEVAAWRPLLQVDSASDMMWGDAGRLYWLARRSDLEAGSLVDTGFTWQCS